MKPKLTNEFKPMITVTAAGEVTGNIREAQAAFEARAETRQDEEREARYKAERKAREKARKAERKQEPAPAPAQAIKRPKKKPKITASYAEKYAWYYPQIQKFWDKGMTNRQIMDRIGMKETAFYRMLKEGAA